MSRQRIIILILCILFFALLTAFIVNRMIRFKQDTYRVGSIPTEIVNQLSPKDVPLARMRPPALRSADPMRFGNVTSVISVIEYGDYGCAACRTMDATIQQVAAPYKGDVRVVWRDFPVENVESKAIPAAVFARCAGMQGKYWQAHDELMRTQTLNDAAYRNIAELIGLDQRTLSSCQKTKAVEDAVRNDMQEAHSDGIKSAPFFFVGTKAFEGAIDADALKKAVEQALNS